MEERIKNGNIVRHFKKEINAGSPMSYTYQVIDINARETDNYERVVIYKALYGGGDFFVRKYDEFMSEVDHNKYPNIKQKYRFEVI